MDHEYKSHESIEIDNILKIKQSTIKPCTPFMGYTVYTDEDADVCLIHCLWENLPKTSSISRTKFQSLNVSCVLLQLSSLNPLKPGVKLRLKM